MNLLLLIPAAWAVYALRWQVDAGHSAISAAALAGALIIAAGGRHKRWLPFAVLLAASFAGAPWLNPPTPAHYARLLLPIAFASGFVDCPEWLLWTARWWAPLGLLVSAVVSPYFADVIGCCLLIVCAGRWALALVPKHREVTFAPAALWLVASAQPSITSVAVSVIVAVALILLTVAVTVDSTR